MSESVCLVDFCGYASPAHFPISFWCDWNPATKLITFGGEWCEVPPVISEVEPGDKEIEAIENFAWWYVRD